MSYYYQHVLRRFRQLCVQQTSFTGATDGKGAVGRVRQVVTYHSQAFAASRRIQDET